MTKLQLTRQIGTLALGCFLLACSGGTTDPGSGNGNGGGGDHGDSGMTTPDATAPVDGGFPNPPDGGDGMAPVDGGGSNEGGSGMPPIDAGSDSSDGGVMGSGISGCWITHTDTGNTRLDLEEHPDQRVTGTLTYASSTYPVEDGAIDDGSLVFRVNWGSFVCNYEFSDISGDALSGVAYCANNTQAITADRTCD